MSLNHSFPYQHKSASIRAEYLFDHTNVQSKENDVYSDHSTPNTLPLDVLRKLICDQFYYRESPNRRYCIRTGTSSIRN